MLRSVYLRMSDCNEWFVSDNLFRLLRHYFFIIFQNFRAIFAAKLIVNINCKWFVSDNFRISGLHSLAFAAKRRILIVNDLFQIISWPAPHWTRLSSPARPLSGARLAAEVRVEVARLYTVHRQLYCTHVSCTHYCTLPGPVISLLSRTSRMETPRKTSQLTTFCHQTTLTSKVLANPEYNKH